MEGSSSRSPSIFVQNTALSEALRSPTEIDIDIKTGGHDQLTMPSRLRYGVLLRLLLTWPVSL